MPLQVSRPSFATAGLAALAALAALAGAVRAAEITLGTATPPKLDGVENLAGTLEPSGNVELLYADSNFLSGDNNGVLGQTFTTGPDPGGYHLRSISFQQVRHDTSWWTGGSIGLRVFQTTDSPDDGVQQMSVLAAESGTLEADGGGLQGAAPGDDALWVTCTLSQSPPVRLEPDTRYGFDIQASGTTASGPFLMEWNGTGGDAHPGGQAIINGSPANPSPDAIWLGDGPGDGDRVFVAAMTAVTPVTISTEAPPAGDGIGNLAGAAGPSGNADVQYSDSNYLAGDNNGVLGQTFTTGSNPGGYQLESISFQQAPYATYWWTGGTIGYRVFQPVDQPGSGVQQMTVLASGRGAVPVLSPGLQSAEPGEDAYWVTIGIPDSPPLLLQPDTQYGFDLQATGTFGGGPFLIEWNGTASDSLAGGQAIINGTPASPTPGAVWLGRGAVDGDRTFVASMRALGPPRLDVEPPADSPTLKLETNPGRWYALEHSGDLLPGSWQDLLAGPVYAPGPALAIDELGLASNIRQFFRLEELDPRFTSRVGPAGAASLRPPGDPAGDDAVGTEFIDPGRELGGVALSYRTSGGAGWETADTSSSEGVQTSWHQAAASTDGVRHRFHHEITGGLDGRLVCETVLLFAGDHVGWTLELTNSSGDPVTIGDLAVPLPMNTDYSGPQTSVFKHSFISGDNSWMFWMRPDSTGPYLTMTPAPGTRLEYWDTLGEGGTYQAYIHSLDAAQIAASLGSEWRQPNTSLTLQPDETRSYGFKLRWAEDYDAVREVLVDEGLIDIHIAPGMTVPTDLSARFALRTTHPVHSVEAEFPTDTTVQYLGPGGPDGDYRIYEVSFSRLGENRLTIHYGDNRVTYLEFFATEPLETLITKRADFLEAKQVRDPSKWYDGLYPEWNMESQTLVTPDNYDLITGFQRYVVAADDAGLSRPAFLALKNVAMPDQGEVDSLDRYIGEFVWGGLQQTPDEAYPYGIYGVIDWHSNRNSPDPGYNGREHLWRTYDYPHIITLYEAMYRIARDNPQITTALTAGEYLQRAHGTAIALFTVPLQVWNIDLWVPYHRGYMNESVLPRLIENLELEGMTAEAAQLRSEWHRKVDYFVAGGADLLASEYSFDSTGFESQQAIGRYAFENAGTLGPADPQGYREAAREFMARVNTANTCLRGWLETAYYHYGSDYRQQAGDWYTLSYMSQLGGWAMLDYALHFAADPGDASPFIRLGYGGYLSSWALLNSGTAESDYGYWYPGAGNDGAAGGGFEPSPYNTNWLQQPVRRGAWYYGSEQDLSFCGAMLAAATILSDDPIFGRFCFGGDHAPAGGEIGITPRDGVRQRFHAVLDSGRLHLRLGNDRFAAGPSITLADDLSQVDFVVESANPSTHDTRLVFNASAPGSYEFGGPAGSIATRALEAGEEATVDLPFPAGGGPATFTVSRQ